MNQKILGEKQVITHCFLLKVDNFLTPSHTQPSLNLALLVIFRFVLSNMTDTRYVRFRYGPTVHTVAMYPGLPSEEFTMILKALLPVHVNGCIIGLQGEQGEVVPVTLSCRSPEILRDSTYVLLVSGETSSAVSTPSVQQTQQVLPSAPPLSFAQQQQQQQEEVYPTNIAPPAPPLKPSTNPVYDDELSAEDAQEVDNIMDELLRFIAGLRVKRIINKTESDALEELLFSNRYRF